jgi:hypothetical protein
MQQVAPEKLGTEEFHCLSELGKFAKETDFKEKVGQFFWSIICNSE